MQYCRNCHRQRPAEHFENYPDHLTTAASAAQGEGEAPRPAARTMRSAPTQHSAASAAAAAQAEKIDEYIGWGAVGVLVGGLAVGIWQMLRGAGGV